MQRLIRVSAFAARRFDMSADVGLWKLVSLHRYLVGHFHNIFLYKLQKSIRNLDFRISGAKKSSFVLVALALNLICFSANKADAQEVGATRWREGYFSTLHGSASEACMVSLAYYNSMVSPVSRLEYRSPMPTDAPQVLSCAGFNYFSMTLIKFAPTTHVCKTDTIWVGVGGASCKGLVSPPAAPLAAQMCPFGGNSQPWAPTVGNPVEIASGHKRHLTLDYQSADGQLVIARSLNFNRANPNLVTDFGLAWAGAREAVAYLSAAFSSPLIVSLKDGVELRFSPGATSWTFTSDYPALQRVRAEPLFTTPTGSAWKDFFLNTAVSWRVTHFDGRVCPW